TGIPVIISSHRAAGYSLPIDLIERLVTRYPHVIGYAYGGTDLQYLADVIKKFSDRIEILCSGIRQAVTPLSLGGHGFMGHEGNLTPVLTASVIAAFRNRDHDALKVNFAKLMAMNAIGDRYGGSSVRALKPVMNAYGMHAGYLRYPRIAIH